MRRLRPPRCLRPDRVGGDVGSRATASRDRAVCDLGRGHRIRGKSAGIDRVVGELGCANGVGGDVGGLDRSAAIAAESTELSASSEAAIASSPMSAALRELSRIRRSRPPRGDLGGIDTVGGDVGGSDRAAWIAPESTELSAISGCADRVGRDVGGGDRVGGDLGRGDGVVGELGVRDEPSARSEPWTVLPAATLTQAEPFER